MKKRTIRMVVLAAVIALSLGAAVLADAIDQTITLTAPATRLSVTVPTSLAAQLTTYESGTGNVSGTVESSITNNSEGSVRVSYTFTVPAGSDMVVSGRPESPVTLTAGETKEITYTITCPAAATWDMTSGNIAVTYTVEWA